MCKKVFTNGSVDRIDPCLVEELKIIKNTFPRFKEKFEMKLSCCGHDKYKKTLVVKNKVSQCHFEWFSGISLDGTPRSIDGAPFYKKDNEGYYYIPEVEELESK